VSADRDGIPALRTSEERSTIREIKHLLAATAANEQRSLTTFSRTGRTTPDTSSNAGQALDYDLRIRIPAH
jgi:hypothetical protein